MVTRLVDYKPGVMKAPTLPGALKRTTDTEAHPPHQHDKAKEKPTIPPATLRAAKLAHKLPASVVARAFSIARRRFELYNPKSNTGRLSDERLREAIERFVLRCRPCVRTQDDWIVVAAHPWPDRHPVRLSVAIVLAGKRILNDERSIGWTHMLDGDWPSVSLPGHPGSLKEQNGLPTVVYLPKPPPALELVKKQIPGNTGIEKPTFVQPPVEDIMAEPDDEYRVWLKSVFLPEDQWEKPVRLGEARAARVRIKSHLDLASSTNLPRHNPSAVAPDLTVAHEATAADMLARMTLDGDDDGLIDPLALLLKPKATDAEAAEDEEHDNEHDEEN